MRSLVACLDTWAAAQPERLLFAFMDSRGRERENYTYRQFQSRTRSVARQLLANSDLRYGDRVVLAYRPGLELVVAFLSCARIGVIPVPAYAPEPLTIAADLARLRGIVRDCGAAAVLSSQDVLESVHTASRHENEETRNHASAILDLTWRATDHLETGHDTGYIDRTHPILFLQYTSGSTGNPRGVIVTHANVLANACSTVQQAGVGVSWLPQVHDMGLIGYYLFPIVHGVTSYGMSPRDFLKRPARWLRLMSSVRAEYASAPNFAYHYCLRPGKIEPGELDGVDLSSLKVLMSAAEPAQEETFKQFQRRFAPYGLDAEAYVVAYGLAENTLAATRDGRRFIRVDSQALGKGAVVPAAHSQRRSARALASCGRPLPGVELRIVDPKTRAVLSEREVGEVWISSKSVCQGYWGRPKLTQEVFRNSLPGEPYEFLRTDDLGFLDNGELFVSGRRRDLVVHRGRNLYPQDIEAAVESASTTIRPGGVAAFTCGDEEDTLVIVVEVRAAQRLPDGAEIARVVRTQCQIEPAVVVVARRSAIARTRSGKIARSVTRERYLNDDLPVIATHRNPATVAATDQAETARRRVLGILEARLNEGHGSWTLEEVGFDSLALIDLLLDLEQVFVERNAPKLVDEVDASLLAAMQVSELHSILSRNQRLTSRSTKQLLARLRALRSRSVADVERQMKCDAILDTSGWGPPGVARSRTRTVLLTGATGFLGAYLLSELLARTPYRYHLLVRAKSEDHGMERIRTALDRAGLADESSRRDLRHRVHIVCGDLSEEDLGLSPSLWDQLAREIDLVVHNAALVNYVSSYASLRPHNVDGTRTMVNFARAARLKPLHYISTTFIFGWSARGRLYEHENNDEMCGLDFGYSQTKWVAEQLVRAASDHGVPVQVYRPALLSPSLAGEGAPDDVALRLLAFMLKHGIAVETPNQLSLVPVDVAAANIAALVAEDGREAPTLHITADEYYSMSDITRAITRLFGFAFLYYDIPAFLRQLNGLCARMDPIYPMLDFFNRSAPKIAAMELKRYDNEHYREARRQAAGAIPHPPLDTVVSTMMTAMHRLGMLEGSELRAGEHNLGRSQRTPRTGRRRRNSNPFTDSPGRASGR